MAISQRVRSSTMRPRALTEALLHAYATNERVNQYLIGYLDDAAWTAKPPSGRGRTIGAIVAHIHNVRRMWLKTTAPGERLPAPLSRHSASRADAQAALAESHRALASVLRRSFAGDLRVKGFAPDAAAFLAYLIAHESHHRGQIAMLARQVGHPVPQHAMFGMWEWSARAKEVAPVSARSRAVSPRF